MGSMMNRYNNNNVMFNDICNDATLWQINLCAMTLRQEEIEHDGLAMTWNYPICSLYFSLGLFISVHDSASELCLLNVSRATMLNRYDEKRYQRIK